MGGRGSGRKPGAAPLTPFGALFTVKVVSVDLTGDFFHVSAESVSQGWPTMIRMTVPYAIGKFLQKDMFIDVDMRER